MTGILDVDHASNSLMRPMVLVAPTSFDGSRRFLQQSRPLPDLTILLRQSIALSDANQNQLPGNSPLGKNLLATANAALSFVSNAIF